MHRWIVGSAVVMLAVAQPLAAQARDSLSLDLTVGPSVGSGGRGHYYSPNDVSGEVTLGYRPHPDHEAALVGAITVGRRSPVEFGYGDKKCVVSPSDLSSGCAPGFPAFGHIGLLGGLELRAARVAVRGLAGPAFYGRGGASGFGGQFHADVAVGFTHLAFVVAARQSVFNSSKDGTIRSRSREFGLRLQ